MRSSWHQTRCSAVQYSRYSAQTCEQQPCGDAGIMQSGVAREDLFITIKTVRVRWVRARQGIWNLGMRSDTLVLLNMRVEFIVVVGLQGVWGILALVGLQGFAGPMGPINKPYLPFGHGQADLMLEWLGLQYADLYLMHEGDLGSTGAAPQSLLLDHSLTHSTFTHSLILLTH